MIEDFRRCMHEGLREIKPDSTVLALGCEQAFLAAQLSEYSSDVTVLDTSAVQIAQLARRFPEISFLQHHVAQPLPFPRDTFDVVWCCEFLDRVFDPAAALREVNRVLKPGGRFLATVPDHGRMRSVLIALFRWEQHFSPANPRIRHFTRTSLERLTREAGLADVRIAKRGAVRRLAGRLVPQTLWLSARKESSTGRRQSAEGRS